MNWAENVIGIQHLGLPTNDLEKTMKFYTSLGFTTALRTRNEAAGEDVCFLTIHNLCIEAYENGKAAGTSGALDHVALNVTNVDEAFETAKASGFQILDSEVQFLPFWDNGVRFFTILGPNGEKIEFSQIL